MNILEAYTGPTIDPYFIYSKYMLDHSLNYEPAETVKRMQGFQSRVPGYVPIADEENVLSAETIGRIDRVVKAIGDYNELAEYHINLNGWQREARASYTPSLSNLLDIFKTVSDVWPRHSAGERLKRVKQVFEEGDFSDNLDKCRFRLEHLFRSLMQTAIAGKPVDGDFDDELEGYELFLEAEAPVIFSVVHDNLAVLAGQPMKLEA